MSKPEYETIKIKTTHDLRPIIELMDLTEEDAQGIIALIGLGAGRASELCEAANNISDAERAKLVRYVATNILVRYYENGKNQS